MAYLILVRQYESLCNFSTNVMTGCLQYKYQLDTIIIIMIYSHQIMHIKSTKISISSADNKGQLRTASLTKNNSSKSNTEALCCVEICELT